MTTFGIALLWVCALSLLDKRALPFSLILAAGWIAGFAGYQWWPVISLASGSLMAVLLHRRSPAWAKVCVSCVPLMLLCDAAYLWALAQNVYLGVEYATALNVLFTVQLLAVGWPGGRRGVRLLVVGIRRADRRWLAGLGSEADGGPGARG